MKKSVQQALEQKGIQVAASAELAAQEVNDWQTLQAYITNRIQNIPLTPGQQAKLERYQFIYNQAVSLKYTEFDVLEMIMRTYSIEYTQAMRDLRAAKELFATTLNINRLLELKATLEWNKRMMQKADEMSDLKAYAQLEKNRQKLLAMLPEDDTHLADMFTPHINEFAFDPSLLGVQAPSPEDINKLLRDMEEKYGGVIRIRTNIEDAQIID